MAMLQPCAAFGADGALAADLLEFPVEGRNVPPGGTLGAVLGAGPTLLVFLRHFG